MKVENTEGGEGLGLVQQVASQLGSPTSYKQYSHTLYFLDLIPYIHILACADKYGLR